MKTKHVVLGAAAAWLLFFGGWNKVKAMVAGKNTTTTTDPISVADIEAAAAAAAADVNNVIAAPQSGAELISAGIDPTTGKPLNDQYTRCDNPLLGGVSI